MITLTKKLPDISSSSLEYLKIKCLFDAYKDDKDTLFWVQNDGQAYISLSFSDMVIANFGADIEELREFIAVINPSSIFGDTDTLDLLNLGEYEAVNVMAGACDIKGEVISDSLSSKEIYEILNVREFDLPEYPYFAVDFCRRLNNGQLNYYAEKESCAAVAVFSGEYALLNGIVSKKKGKGTKALQNIIKLNYGRKMLAVCRDNVLGFYEKNGFKRLYKVGYLCKTKI